MQKTKMEGTLSARPKVRTNVFHKTHKITYEPLEKKSINFVDQDGNKKSISLISKEFNIMMNCVTYYEPSFEELNKILQKDAEEYRINWEINCRNYERMLLSIIDIPYFRFWSVMSFNSDVRAALDSYLFNASRPYRLHPVLKTLNKSDGFKSTLSNIHRLIFKIFIRILVYKESEANYMTKAYHAQIVRDILDVPKILNLLQIYGYGSNSEILRYLFKDFIDCDSKQFKCDFKTVVEDIVLLLNRGAGDDLELQNDNYLMQLYLLVINTADIMLSLNKAVLIDPQLSSVYLQCKLPEALLSFYCKYFPFIEKKCEDFLQRNIIVEKLNNFLRSQITLAQSCALLLFHHLLKNDYISPINQVNMENQMFDGLINILNSVINHKRFCFDYFTKFSFDKEFHSLLTNQELNEQLSIGDVLDYYKMTLKTTISEFASANSSSSKAASERKISNLMNFNYEQNETPQSSSSETNEPVMNDIKTDPETTMKEQLIREMFPDFADGFVYKCLEHYDFDNEKVLDAILENNLPPHLDSLNRQLSKNDLLKARSAAILGQSTSKQKDSHDPTTKKDLQLVDIYIGKKDKISNLQSDKNAMKEKTIGLMENIHREEVEAKENVKNLMERGKLTKSDLTTNIEYIGLYDDEFDDTYENEDASFDQDEAQFDDPEDASDEEDNPNESQPNDPSRPSFRQPQEKFDGSARYSRNQFYNKRSYNRKQNQTDSSGPSKSQGQTFNRPSNQNQNWQNTSANHMSNQTSSQPTNQSTNQNTNARKNYHSNDRPTENKSNDNMNSNANANNTNPASGNKGNFYRNLANSSNRGNVRSQGHRGGYQSNSNQNHGGRRN